MPPELRVLLVDDEPHVLRLARDVLSTQADVAVVGEAGDGPAAIDAIEALRPDVVLLDVQMPGCDGFEVLAALEPERRPVVVFVTAFEQYALRAFEARAVDYLLKPFDDERLLSAVARARSWVERGAADVDGLLDDVAGTRSRERFVVRQAGRVRVLPAHEVRWIEARGNYVHLHHAHGAFLLRETIRALADTLDPRRFVRVHRSAIVALPEVRELVRQDSGAHVLRLATGEEVPLGRSYRPQFERRWRAR